MRGWAGWILFGLATTAHAGTTLPDDFSTLFATTCMQHFQEPDDLRGALQDGGAELVPAQNSDAFLGGESGQAWIIKGATTRYVVSLRDDGVCAVFAQQAERASTEADFIDLVGSSPEPMVARKEDAAKLGPNNEHSRTLAYSWTLPGQQSQLLFVLTTSTSTEVLAQAMASLSEVALEKD